MSRLRELLLTVLAAAVILFAPHVAIGQTSPASEPAKIKVFVPADAVLHVDGAQTQSTGEIRNFLSPPLIPGRKFIYTLRATWKENGKEVDRERTVRVEAGIETVVDFRAPAPPIEQRAVVPAADVVEKMLELADVKKGDVIYDPRCGDGSVLIKAAQKYSAKGLGFDSDQQRVNDALENVKKNLVTDLVAINKQDIPELDFKDASVVVLHLSAEWNVKLMSQLAKLKPGSRIVSDDFDMKGAKPAKKISYAAKGSNIGAGTEHTLYLWVVPWEKE